MNLSADIDPNPGDDPVSWDYSNREYKAVHTRQGRIAQICFIPNGIAFDRFLPLADLRLMDPSKDGRELILEFSDITVVITGFNLRRSADTIAVGGVAALEAFDPVLRDRPDPEQRNAPFIQEIRFFKPEAKSETTSYPDQEMPKVDQPFHLNAA